MQAPEGLESPPQRLRLWDRHASPISILVLGALLLAAVLGFTGGQPSPPRTADFGAARLTVKTPAIIRNGEFFETDVTLTANGPLEPGERLRVKIDGQINPPLFAGTQGDIAVFDGERRIGAIPLRIKVLP